jgi:hypothetical protein
MRTLKSLFIISTILLVSGYSYANGSGPKDLGEVKNNVRQKIASAIEAADLRGKGQATLKFGITEQNNLQILKIETNDFSLSKKLEDALVRANIIFPKGSRGNYEIKVFVNQDQNYKFEAVRNQISTAVESIKFPVSESVNVKFRVVNPTNVLVTKTDCANEELAKTVKMAIEEGKYNFPKNLNGEYNICVSFK